MIDLLRHLHSALHDRKDTTKQKAADRSALFKRVFGTEDGERALLELAMMAGVLRTFPPLTPPHSLHAVEGKRELFYDIARELTAIANEDGSITYMYNHADLNDG